MQNDKRFLNLSMLLRQTPSAYAIINGSDQYPDLHGRTLFYQLEGSVFVCTEVSGLPKNADKCKQPIFAFHIHSGESCTGNSDDPFANTLSHYDANGCPHPYHAGDLPPLFGADGFAVSAVLTDRFNVSEVIGRTVIIHSMPDDFTTQPSGNSGIKIACGEIKGEMKER